jgi:Holliday junction resolvase RusA-like endonuclease
MIELNLPVIPVPWAAPVRSRGAFYDIRDANKRCAKFYIKQQYSAIPIEDYTVLEFTFTFPLPPSASKKKRAQMLAGEIIPTKCDCTNLQKLYEDCLKKIVIDDDRKVAKIFSEKLYGEKEGVKINIYTLEEYKNADRSRRD